LSSKPSGKNCGLMPSDQLFSYFMARTSYFSTRSWGL